MVLAEVHGPDVVRLRHRLYRPDPPPDAVDAYLAAVGTSEARAAVVASPTARRRGPMAVAAALVALPVLAVVAAAPAPVPSTPAVPPARTAPAPLPMPAMAGRPIGAATDEDGPIARFEADGRRVVLDLVCSGEGVLTVRLADGPPVQLTCPRGGAALAMLGSDGPLGRFTVEVRSDAPIRWSIAAAGLPARPGPTTAAGPAAGSAERPVRPARTP